MTERDYEIVEALLLRISRERDSGRLVVVEWGAGKSTVSLSTILREHGQSFIWLTIEHDRAFLNREVIPHLPDGTVHLELDGRASDISAVRSSVAHPLEQQAVVLASFNVGPVFPAQRGPSSRDAGVDLDSYVSLASDVLEGVDIALIDGRKRRRCLIEASQLIGSNGIALLHDAYRSHYHCAFENFRYGKRVGDELWLGHHNARRLVSGTLHNSAFSQTSAEPLSESLSGWQPPSE